MDTSMKIDGDTVLFIADGLSADVKATRTNAVEGARAYRSGSWAFADLLGMK